MKKTFEYKNPVYSEAIEAIRDCQIFKDGGLYYLIGTSPPFFPHYFPEQGPNPGIKIYSSSNLLIWKFEKFLIKREDVSEKAWYRDHFWAPEIHLKNGLYYLSFNCRNLKTGFPHSCGLAVSARILGPYTVLTHEQPLTKGNDLTVFTDDDERSYIYRSGIYAQEINLESCTLLREPVPCFSPEEGKWDAVGIEGPYVIKRAGTYYLFYSSWTRGYEIGYATASSPLGPWKKWEGNPFFGAQDPKSCKKNGVSFTGNLNSPLNAVGHNTIFTGPDGRDWLTCHYREKGGRESLGFDPIWLESGEIRSNGPTCTTQVVEWINS